MEQTANKTLCKVIGIFSCLLLVFIAASFAMLSMVALFFLIMEGGFINFMGFIAAAFVAWVAWSVRKDPLA